MNHARLDSSRDALRYQREWFQKLTRSAEAGEPVALVNADVPHEVLRTLGVEYVVNQWWASVVTAAGAGQSALEKIAALGYPSDSETYNAIALGNLLDAHGDIPGWGRLPRPFLIVADLTSDTSGKVVDAWTELTGVDGFRFEDPALSVVDPEWWSSISHEWERIVGSERIDLKVAEIGALIEYLERATQRHWDRERLSDIMRLANEHAEWNRRTRDLIASARPLPVRLTDIIPAVMIPQWHRGTEWGRDAAESLYREVADRVRAGTAVVPEDRARLMWIGRGLWFDLDFYRHFESEFGAVFVWSMYLGMAADGYARYGGDDLRALASRFVGFQERLYVPPSSVEWYVSEARRHGVDGVVHLVSDDPRGSWPITRGLEAAGFPVYELHAENADESAYDVEQTRAGVAEWLTTTVLSKGTR